MMWQPELTTDVAAGVNDGGGAQQGEEGKTRGHQCPTTTEVTGDSPKRRKEVGGGELWKRWLYFMTCSISMDSKGMCSKLEKAQNLVIPNPTGNGPQFQFQFHKIFKQMIFQRTKQGVRIFSEIVQDKTCKLSLVGVATR